MQGLASGGTDFMMESGKEMAEQMAGHPIRNFHEFIGFPEIRKLEEEYLPSEEVQRKYAETVGYQP
jgi:hypothetical protein